jgi:integrase
VTEPAGRAAADPAGAVVAAVTATVPGLDPGMIRAAVEDSGGRARRRRLAAALAADPSVLTSGRSPAPPVVGDLLLALRTAGAAAISLPRCAACDREITSVQRHGRNWYCSVCVRRLSLRTCASCGRERPAVSRDRSGQPRCGQCPDRDGRDPLTVLTAVITGLDPSLPAGAAADAVRRVFTRQGSLRHLAWMVESRPGLLTGDGAQAPAAAVLRLIDELSVAGAQKIVRPACPHCGRVVRLHRRVRGQWSCRNCAAKAAAVPCSRCGTTREPAARDGDGLPLCPNCLVSDPANQEECIRCGRRRVVNTRSPDGPVCATCIPRTTACCSMCGRTVPCIVSRTTGQPWCGACTRHQAECSRCGQLAAIRAGTRQEPLCAACAVPDQGFWKACTSCGAGGRLIAGTCRRCQLSSQLGEFLAGPGGAIRPELRVLHDTLAGAERPDTVLKWLKNDTTRTVLAGLAAGQRPLSHVALDELPSGKPIEHLRSILVATGALPARDEQLARIERWVAQAVSMHADDPEDKELLHRYAAWHLLRRLRQRNRGADTTYGQLDVTRQRVRAAIGLLSWLRDRGLTLTSCSQPDLDAWLAGNDATRKAETGHFVRWAISHRISPRLQFAATRWTGPARPLDHDERWQQTSRLLHDGTLGTGDRVAGLLVLLYAQRPAAISRLTLDDIDTSDGTVRLRLGPVPVQLPEPLAALTRELAAARKGHAVLGDQGTSHWLFPGGQPGRPVSADRLGERLRQLGLRPGQARSTALFQLATELPAAVLARLLGIHIKVAVAWQHVSAGDWTSYAADISRRLDQ